MIFYNVYTSPAIFFLHLKHSHLPKRPHYHIIFPEEAGKRFYMQISAFWNLSYCWTLNYPAGDSAVKVKIELWAHWPVVTRGWYFNPLRNIGILHQHLKRSILRYESHFFFFFLQEQQESKMPWRFVLSLALQAGKFKAKKRLGSNPEKWRLGDLPALKEKYVKGRPQPKTIAQSRMKSPSKGVYHLMQMYVGIYRGKCRSRGHSTTCSRLCVET